MAVAGPDLSGSGLGVPVPSMTICVCAGCACDCSFMVSVRPDIRGLNDGLPSFGDAFEQGAGVGSAAADRLEGLHTEALLQFGGLQAVLDLAFQHAANGFRSTSGRKHHLI